MAATDSNAGVPVTVPRAEATAAPAAPVKAEAKLATPVAAPKAVVPAVAPVARPAPVASPAIVAAKAVPNPEITTAARKAAVKKAPAKKVAAKKAPLKKAPVAAKAKSPKPVVVAAAAKAAAPLTETAASVIRPAARKAARTIKKEVTIMATKFETPKVFADFNERAQAAVEKGNKFAQEIGDFGKGNVEALVESGRIAAKGFEALGQEAADYSRKSFEGLTATLKNMASVKSPADFFKLQSDYLRASFDSAVAQSSKNTEAMIKLAGDAAQPLSSRVALAVEKVKAAA